MKAQMRRKNYLIGAQWLKTGNEDSSSATGGSVRRSEAANSAENLADTVTKIMEIDSMKSGHTDYNAPAGENGCDNNGKERVLGKSGENIDSNKVEDLVNLSEKDMTIMLENKKRRMDMDTVEKLRVSLGFDGAFSADVQGLNKKQEKLTHLHFYFHDVVSGPNPTAIRVAEAKTTNTSAVSFGFVVVCDDPLTVGPEPTSKKIGSAQGIYASTSQTELSLLMALNYVFTEGKYKGSTLSILGRNAVLSGVREMPIVGGSGVFRFARGFALAKTYVANATTFDAIVEYNVYVLHY
ncbi:hypothetical protein F8388_013341 [Cannabis sativa]|uniref:Dirigent protein n=1 Tax=Cannabis sativa TaxID=3483 RepID=A0A7J6FE97_CANSA|nr:hypothetical protein F8388_013341 [Cannabis sativa]